MSIFRRLNKKEASGGAPDLRDVLRSLAKNEIAIKEDGKGKAVAPDASKIGGKPYLPADFIWPTFQSYDDDVIRPLSFFCQLRLEEVKAYDRDGVLPEKGILSFFYECESATWGFDPADYGAAKVFYFENIDGFSQRELPDDLAAEYRIPEIALSFRSQVSYPTFDEFADYSDLACEWDEYDKVRAKLGVDPERDPEGAKILGYADTIQDEMLTECEWIHRGLYCGNVNSTRNTPEDVRAEVKAHAKDWTLLLQLSTIATDNFEYMFGDCGMLYFYIRKDDLAARRFGETEFCVQCC